jgi:protein TonB
MPLGPQEVPPKGISGEALGFLRGCLVEGDPEQQNRERRARRRALAISMVFESAVLAVLILISLFGRTPPIALANMTPIPPYSPYRNGSHTSGARQHSNGPKNACHFCVLPHIPPTIPIRDSGSSERDRSEPPFEALGSGIPGAPDGLIPLSDSRRKALPPDDTQHRVRPPRTLHFTHLDSAMLIRRVEPVYPPLAKQMHHDGRVELRAVIGTDGTIQSLQIVVGDPLFDQSALEAVEQWRYKPTILNGQPVEIDTYITVVYTMQH